MKDVGKLKERLFVEIMEGQKTPSKAAEEFAFATATAFHAGECYLSYEEGNFDDLAAEWIDTNLDTNCEFEVEDCLPAAAPEPQLIAAAGTDG